MSARLCSLPGIVVLDWWLQLEMRLSAIVRLEKVLLDLLVNPGRLLSFPRCRWPDGCQTVLIAL